MRQRIMSRAFYGWYKHYKQSKTLKKHLIDLVLPPSPDTESSSNDIDSLLTEYARDGRELDESLWRRIAESGGAFNRSLFYKLVYQEGVESNELRRQVWPYLLGVFGFEMSREDVDARLKEARDSFARVMSEWQPVEAHVKEKNLNESSITPIKSLSVSCGQEDSGVGSGFTDSASSRDSNLERKSSRAKQMQTPIRSSLASNRKSDKGKFNKSKSKIRWSSPIETRTGAHKDPSHDLDLSSFIIKVRFNHLQQ